MNAFDVICLGDATIDVFLPLNKADQNYRINDREISFELGDKFLVDGYKLFLGGIASNVAVSLSRLGKKVALVTEVGEDELSETILKRLKAEGVITDLIVKGKNTQTTLSVIISSQKNHILFVAHNPKDHRFDFKDSITSWIYLTGLGNNWEHAYENAVAFAKEKNVKIAFAPGISQIQGGKEKIMNVLGNSEIIFLNKNEAQMISGENQDVKSLLSSLRKYGSKVIVITDGLNGSYVLDENLNFFHLGISEVDVVETTGAGDAYAGAFFAVGSFLRRHRDFISKIYLSC